MSNLKENLELLCKEFDDVEKLLKGILKYVSSLKKDVLIKKGFFVRKYELKYGALKQAAIDGIKNAVEDLRKKEIEFWQTLENNKEALEVAEKWYREVYKDQLHSDLIEESIKQILYYSELLSRRIDQLSEKLASGMKVHSKTTIEKDSIMFFASFESVANKLMKHINLLKQLNTKISKFEQTSSYRTPRTYGRAMNLNEYKETIEKGRLCSGKNPTPVFDAPDSVFSKIISMPPDERKNFFSTIGVEGGFKIVFFKTKLKPINAETPIPQSNGLREYKFPKGLEIEIVQAA